MWARWTRPTLGREGSNRDKEKNRAALGRARPNKLKKYQHEPFFTPDEADLNSIRSNHLTVGDPSRANINDEVDLWLIGRVRLLVTRGF